MENLNLILFIGIAAPLGMMLLVCKERARRVILFLLIGMMNCLLCGEIDGRLLNLTGFSKSYLTCNITPVTEEFFKALPVFLYAFTDKPERQHLIEVAIAVGVGFAVQENAYILASNLGTISIFQGIIRGCTCGLMHGICTTAVGFGMSYVQSKQKLYIAGAFALFNTAVIIHAIYNTLVQSPVQWVAYIMPIIIFVLLILGLKKHRMQ